MDISFLYSYKGTLYPLQLGEQSADPRSNVSTLVDLSSLKIVDDAASTLRAVNTIPQELCYSLMKAALVQTKDRAIEILIANWPSPVLKLARFAPCLFSDLGALYNDVYLGEQMRRGVKYTTCLAHTFVECLKKRSPTKLKCLDLTGYPAAEVIVNYLSSHVLLVYNEVRQREIITMYNEVTRSLPDEQRHSYGVDTTLPEDSFVMVVDAFLHSNEAHMELCRALKTSRLPQCKFKLRLAKLDLSCFGVARISVLLEQIDPQYLSGLSLQYNSIGDEGLLILAPAIQRLPHLSCLDLSSNNINLTKPDTAAILAQALASLPGLTRLDLSNNRTKTGLFKILSGVQKALEYLRVSGCGLSEWDLTYLKGSHHAAQGLRHLDLSENELSGGNKSQILLELIEVVAPQLAVLEVENCQFTQQNFLALFAKCRCLQALKFLNLSRNDELVTSLILDNVGKLVDMESLDVLRMSFPRECYELADSEDAIETFKIELSHRISSLMNSMCERVGRRYIKFVLTQSRFDL